MKIIYFRIDDISFKKSQYKNLNKVIDLAKKLDIVFNLGLIAESFDKNADAKTFSLYQNNKDIFQIIAHGYDHKRGEFFAPYDIQETYFLLMIDIYKKNNFYWATKILTLPWNRGNNNTIRLANRLGYKLLIKKNKLNIEYRFDNLRVCSSFLNFKQITGNHFPEQIVMHLDDFTKLDIHKMYYILSKGKTGFISNKIL